MTPQSKTHKYLVERHAVVGSDGFLDDGGDLVLEDREPVGAVVRAGLQVNGVGGVERGVGEEGEGLAAGSHTTGSQVSTCKQNN